MAKRSFREYWNKLNQPQRYALAERCELSYQQLYQYASGARKPGVENLRKIQKATGLSFRAIRP